MFSYDAILSKMDDPNILWGDLLVDTDTGRRLLDVAARQPDVARRKSIQKHFPVIVRQRQQTVQIQWNVHKLAVWRELHPNPLDWKPYETKTARDMFEALRNSGWEVCAPSDPSFLCSIKRGSKDESVETPFTYEEPDCPALICLNDIKLFFPVIWHKMENENCKVYSIELYHDKIKSVSTQRGVNSVLLTNHLSSLLMTTLAQSPAWKIAQSQSPGEHCRIVLGG
jgi:hypothetical protein